MSYVLFLYQAAICRQNHVHYYYYKKKLTHTEDSFLYTPWSSCTVTRCKASRSPMGDLALTCETRSLNDVGASSPVCHCWHTQVQEAKETAQSCLIPLISSFTLPSYFLPSLFPSFISLWSCPDPAFVAFLLERNISDEEIKSKLRVYVFIFSYV